MRRNGHIPLQFSLKVEKFRKQIRERQIEQYKRKIRKQLYQVNQTNSIIWPRIDQAGNHGANKSYNSIGYQVNDKQMKMLNICQCIQTWQDKYKQLLCSQQNNKENKQTSNQVNQIKYKINECYIDLIDGLINDGFEDKSGSTNEQQQQELRNNQDIIMNKISELSNIGLKVITNEQRCKISYFVDSYLLKILDRFKQYEQDRNIHGIDWVAEADKLQCIVTYVMNIMQKDIERENQHNYHLRSDDTHPFDITVLEQSILINLVIGFSEMLSWVSLRSLFNQYLSNVEKTGLQYKMEKSIKTPKIMELINSLAYLHRYYIKLYCDELRHNQNINKDIQCLELQLEHYPSLDLVESEQQIGSINLATFKEMLKIFAYFLSTFHESLQDYNFINYPTSKMVIQSLSNQLRRYINTCIDFLAQFNSILQILPNQQIKILENQTADDKHSTVLAIYCLIVDSITNLISYFEKTEEQSIVTIQGQFQQQLSFSFLAINNKKQRKKQAQKISQLFFDEIKNKQLIISIHTLISRKLYTQQYISELYSETKLPIYIMTCIFSCKYTQSSQHIFSNGNHIKNISYNKYRQSQSRIRFTVSLELQCLKTILQFLNNYGIKIDIEDNLQMRYLTKIGDGTANDFYYSNLSKQRSFVK